MNDKISEIMYNRGYEHHHTSVSLYECFNKRTDDDYLITAYVYEDSNQIELVYYGLKLYMRITTGKFSLTHPNFERYEKIILFYAKLCSQNNPFDLGL